MENKRLVIVADGALQYIPFAALSIGIDRKSVRPDSLNPDPLILKHEIVYQPSASALSLIRAATRYHPPKTVAVLADPVFDQADDRVGRSLKQSATDPVSPVSLREFKR